MTPRARALPPKCGAPEIPPYIILWRCAGPRGCWWAEGGESDNVPNGTLYHAYPKGYLPSPKSRPRGKAGK